MTKKIQKGLRKQIMGKKETAPQRRVGWRWKRCLKLTWTTADRTDKRWWQRLCQISWLKRVWKMPPAAAARSQDTQNHVDTRMCANARMCLLLFTGTRCTLGYTWRIFMSREIFRMSGNWPTWSMKTINLVQTLKVGQTAYLSVSKYLIMSQAEKQWILPVRCHLPALWPQQRAAGTNMYTGSWRTSPLTGREQNRSCHCAPKRHTHTHEDLIYLRYLPAPSSVSLAACCSCLQLKWWSLPGRTARPSLVLSRRLRRCAPS